MKRAHKKRPKSRGKKITKYCEKCGKEFPTTWHVKRHERIHTGEQPFQCEFCDMRFNQLTNLCQHKKRLHSKALEILEETQLRIRARKIVNQVVHYRYRIDEDNEEGSVKGKWVAIFDVEDFNDVVEFEKLMSAI